MAKGTWCLSLALRERAGIRVNAGAVEAWWTERKRTISNDQLGAYSLGLRGEGWHTKIEKLERW